MHSQCGKLIAELPRVLIDLNLPYPYNRPYHQSIDEKMAGRFVWLIPACRTQAHTRRNTYYQSLFRCNSVVLDSEAADSRTVKLAQNQYNEYQAPTHHKIKRRVAFLY